MEVYHLEAASNLEAVTLGMTQALGCALMITNQPVSIQCQIYTVVAVIVAVHGYNNNSYWRYNCATIGYWFGCSISTVTIILHTIPMKLI